MPRIRGEQVEVISFCVATPQMILMLYYSFEIMLSIKHKPGMNNLCYTTMGKLLNPSWMYFPHLQSEKADLDQQVSNSLL